MLTKELGGRSFEDLGLWSEADGFSVQPAPLADDMAQLPLYGRTVADLRFNNHNNNWHSHFEIVVSDVAEANRKALYALQCGADGLTFDLGNVHRTDDEIAHLLFGIQLEILSIGFKNVRNPRRKQEAFFKLCAQRNIAKSAIMGGIWLSAPTTTAEVEPFVNQLMPLVLNADGCERFGSLGADCTEFHMLGGNIPQQIGLSLAVGHEMMLHLRQNGVKWETLSHHFGFMFMVGPSFIPEIARTRLMRFLWARLLQEYGCSEKHSRTYLHGVTSLLHRSEKDVPNNLLRANAQAMSAVMGGVDALTVHPFRTDKDPTLAQRMAINTQHLMRDEARLHEAIDPMAGAFYLEATTDALATAAWDIFKTIEAQGGYFKALEKGTVRTMLEQSAKAYQNEVDSQKRVVVGVNKFPTPFKESNVESES